MCSSRVWAYVAVVAAFSAPAAFAEKRPLSAINWLSQSVKTPPATGVQPVQPDAVTPSRVVNGTQATLPAMAGEVAVTQSSALPQPVAVSVLGGPSPDAVGLLPANVTGFPRSLWGPGRSADIATAIGTVRLDGLPALQGLLMTLLLAEADAPPDSAGSGLLLMARIDKLLEIGALDQAQALINAAGPTNSPELFRRSFDVALLTGEEGRACEVMQGAPGLAPTLTARVFCLARASDWSTAALTLRTSQALGQTDPADDLLLTRFLDPDLFDGDPMPAPPKPISPLIWRIYDALGEPVSTATLPPAFAHAELSERAGWKAQIEAAERLAHAGVIAPNVLLGLYTDRTPSASGGVWDRADAFQRFDAALTKGDAEAVEQRLPLAYARMKDVELEVTFAALFANALSNLKLTGDAARISYELGLLSPDYERLSKGDAAALDARSLFLAGLAVGSVKDLVAPDSMARAIAPAFIAPQLPADLEPMIAEGRTGEAILAAMGLITQGLGGELVKVTEGLSVLRKLGLEDVARRTAIELILLERRG